MKGDDQVPQIPSSANDLERGSTPRPVSPLPALSSLPTPSPTAAREHRNVTSASPTTLPFRSKVATLRPPALDPTKSVQGRTPGVIELDGSEAKSLPSSPPLASDEDGDVLALLNLDPPPPLPMPGSLPARSASGSHFCNAPTVMAVPSSALLESEERSVRLPANTESSLVFHTPEPTRAFRGRRKGFATIGACLTILVLVGWLLSKRHHPAASAAISDAPTTPVGSAAPDVPPAPAVIADNAAPIDHAPAQSKSPGTAGKSKPKAPRRSAPVQSRHK